MPRIYFANKPDEAMLRELYCNQRLSTQQIADRIGASPTSIKNWIKKYNIPPRAATRGLLNRGIEPPSREDLEQFVHQEHMSYEEIARLYGVDKSSITHWLRKHEIRRPSVWETRHKGKVFPRLDQATLRRLYDSGMSTLEIGKLYDRSQWVVADLCEKYGIEKRAGGWNPDGFPCKDGHHVRSSYEVRVCDWLSSRSIPHIYEPSLPASPYHADFEANGWYIEIWGVTDNPTYAERRIRKEVYYRDRALPLISIDVHHFNKRRTSLDRKLSACLQPVLTPLGF